MPLQKILMMKVPFSNCLKTSNTKYIIFEDFSPSCNKLVVACFSVVARQKIAKILRLTY